MEIRVYHAGDERAVIALWTEVFGYPAPHNDPATAIRRKSAVQPELFFVAVEDGAIVGTVMGGYDGHRGWIYSLAVAPRAQRRGIGTALVRQIEQALITRDCPKINLRVLSANAATVAFYQKLGYSVEERISMGKAVLRQVAE